MGLIDNLVTSWIIFPFIFFIGTVLASLGALMAFRIPHIYGYIENPIQDMTFNYPSSHCEGCKRSLSWKELIPVLGFIATKGKCKTCDFRVPKQYPALETLLGSIFCINFYLWGPTSGFALISIVIWVSYIACLVDWETTYIPDFSTTSMLFLGLIATPVVQHPESSIYGAASGWFLFSIVFWFISKIKDIDAYASGDVAFAAMVGAWIGIEYITEYLFLASVLFIAIAGPLRKKGKIWVPMGPALGAAFLIEMWIIKLDIHLFPTINFYF